MPGFLRTNTLIAYGLAVSVVLAIGLGVTTNERVLAATAVGTAAASVVVGLELLRQTEVERYRRDKYGELIAAISRLVRSDQYGTVESIVRLIPAIKAFSEAEREETVAFAQSLAASLDDPHLHEKAEARLETAKATLVSIRDGRVILPRQARPVMTDLYAVLDGPIRATTGTKDAGWWASEVGQEYITANRLAHQTQGKEIRRVFILDDDPDSRSRLVDSAIAANVDAGVTVRVIDKSELREESTRHLLINMTAFGRQFVHRDINNECGETVEYLYSTVHADVSRLTLLFDDLWVRAHDCMPQP